MAWTQEVTGLTPQTHRIPAKMTLLRTEKKPDRELERQDGPNSLLSFGTE